MLPDKKLMQKNNNITFCHHETATYLKYNYRDGGWIGKNDIRYSIHNVIRYIYSFYLWVYLSRCNISFTLSTCTWSHLLTLQLFTHMRSEPFKGETDLWVGYVRAVHQTYAIDQHCILNESSYNRQLLVQMSFCINLVRIEK